MSLTMYKLVRGATIEGLHIKMRRVMVEAGRLYNRHGKRLTITCGLNGEHTNGSLHPYGLALDFRTRFFSRDTQRRITDQLQHALGKDYDVILTPTHLHVEYDPKGEL